MVSNLGRIKSLPRKVEMPKGGYKITKEKVRKTTFNCRNDYEQIAIKTKGKTKTLYIHRLVAQAFIPNPYNKPQVDHIDTNRRNNNVNNLMWVTPKENQNNPKTLERMQGINKGRKHSEETKKKIIKALIGRKHSEETKLKIGLGNKNKKAPTGHMLKMTNLAAEKNRKTIECWSKEGKFIKAFCSIREASNATGANPSGISRCAKGFLKSVGGYVWKYGKK